MSGQNSNNSVSLTDDFLRAVENDGDWNLIRRTDGKVHKTLKARELWDQIGYAAWASADPGLHFNTTMNDWHTCPAAGSIRASNPCSEYMFLDDTACNLASLNLIQFREEADKDGARRFDTAALEHATRLWTIVLEISVLMAQFPSKEIARLSYDYRTLGLGFANIGGLLMTAGIPYDSKEGRAICGAIAALMTGIAYKTSAEMAGVLSPFPDYERNAESMLRVMRNHARAAHGIANGYEGLSVDPVPLDHVSLKDKRLSGPGQGGLDRGRRARLEERLSQCAGLGRGADRHDRPRHGLRHHRHRARLRAGEVQEARRRGLLQDHQPRRAPCPAHSLGYWLKRRSPRWKPMPSGTARSSQAPGVNSALAEAPGALPTTLIADAQRAR